MTEETGAPAEPIVAAEPEDTRDAVDKAFDRVFGDQPRDESGRFAPKTEKEAEEAPEPAAEAPQEPEAPAEPEKPAEPVEAAPERFSADAKAEWAKLPANVRGETLRMQRELESGLEKYRQTVEPLKPFIDMAGDPQRLVGALRNYVGIEQELARDPVAGLDLICRNLGTTLADVAAKVTGQPAPAKDETIARLEAEIRALKGTVGTVQQTFQQTREQETQRAVADFAKNHPRFDELAGDIAQMLKTGFATSLEDAYTKADRLNPVPAAPAPAVAPPPPPAPQTRKAGLSIQGAPGSDPQTRPKSVSTAQAIDRAFGQVGLG